MIVLVDMDNVITDFNKQIISYMRDFGFHSDGMEHYLLSENFNPAKKNKMDVNICLKQIMGNTPGFWITMMLIHGAKENLEILYDRHEIYIVTMAYWGSEYCLLEKEDWIRKNLPFIEKERLIFCSSKWMLNGDILIDDSPEQIKKFCGTPIIYDYPYNESVRKGIRVKNWDDISRVFRGFDEPSRKKKVQSC